MTCLQHKHVIKIETNSNTIIKLLTMVNNFKAIVGKALRYMAGCDNNLLRRRSRTESIIFNLIVKIGDNPLGSLNKKNVKEERNKIWCEKQSLIVNTLYKFLKNYIPDANDEAHQILVAYTLSIYYNIQSEPKKLRANIPGYKKFKIMCEYFIDMLESENITLINIKSI